MCSPCAAGKAYEEVEQLLHNSLLPLAAPELIAAATKGGDAAAAEAVPAPPGSEPPADQFEVCRTPLKPASCAQKQLIASSQVAKRASTTANAVNQDSNSARRHDAQLACAVQCSIGTNNKTCSF